MFPAETEDWTAAELKSPPQPQVPIPRSIEKLKSASSMLQSLLSKKYSPVTSAVAGMVATAVVVTIYWTTSAAASKKGEDDPSAHKPPYPASTLPLLGNTLELMSNAARIHDWLLEQLLPRDGQAIMLRLPGKPDMMFTARPEHYEEILKTQFASFSKSAVSHDLMYDLGGDGILTATGNAWKRQRQVFNALFAARGLREHMTPLSQKYAALLCDVVARAAESKQTLDAYYLFHRFTLDLFVEIAFGTQLGLLKSGIGHPDRFEEAIEDALYYLGLRMRQPTVMWKLKRWLNVGSERKLREPVQLINEHVMGIVSDAFEKRRLDKERSKDEKDGTPEKKDIISILLNRMQNDKDPMTPSFVRDIAVTALLAGRNSTADTLGWLFHILTKNPHVATKLRAELLAKIPKLATDDRYVPSVEEIDTVTYVEATIRELLRLYPGAPLIQTYCARDVVLSDGTFVPANTDITLVFYTTARLKSVWGPDADVFNPERFLDPETGKLLSVPHSKFCSFSHGPRICPGQALAMIELKTVVATLHSRFRFTPDPQQKEVVSKQGFTMGMKHPLLMRVERVGTSGVKVRE